ncbi:MAG: hypothetical protein M2R46_04153 [Verrucomicrobia subdivision 3 bacterium]|nr:hypothetical protein [Limisphaerales bacterium]
MPMLIVTGSSVRALRVNINSQGDEVPSLKVLVLAVMLTCVGFGFSGGVMTSSRVEAMIRLSI